MHIKRIYIAFILLTCIGSGTLGRGYCEAMTPKQAYFNAESCYKKLRSAPAKMKYRDNWLRCIKKFQTVYRLDSAGPWAPAGLYMSGKLYKELAKRSWKASDQQEAHDIFERIIKRFPESKYHAKAAAELRALSKSPIAKKKTAPSKTTRKPKQSAEERYLAAESCYSNLKQSSRKMDLRHNWLQCIEKFYSVYRRDPTGDRAAPSLFMTGKLYGDLYQRSKRKSDLRAAHTMYNKVVVSFPDSRYKVKASLLIDAMPQWVKKDSENQKGDLARIIEDGTKNQTGGQRQAVGPDSLVSGSWGIVNDLRFWSNPN
jgi:tetratricopeptide (TPR) repeat protein